MTDLAIERLVGPEIERGLDDLARLRMTVFREWPYLYDGDIEYERRYLGIYARSPRAMVLLVRDGGRAVGATSAVPLDDEDAALRAPFERAGIEPARVIYLGESILLGDFRGRGLYRRFFSEREAHGRALGGFDTAAFCSVVRPDDHPLRPAGWEPLDPVWQRFGYVPRDDLIATFPWRDLGDANETEKPMRFWTKPLG